jgi:hypothetical protein
MRHAHCFYFPFLTVRESRLFRAGRLAADVAFPLRRFAFAAHNRAGRSYMSLVTEMPHPTSEGTPCNPLAWRRVVKFFSRLFAARRTNMTTALERQRFARTMPGQTGAIASSRLGLVVM